MIHKCLHLVQILLSPVHISSLKVKKGGHPLVGDRGQPISDVIAQASYTVVFGDRVFHWLGTCQRPGICPSLPTSWDYKCMTPQRAFCASAGGPNSGPRDGIVRAPVPEPSPGSRGSVLNAPVLLTCIQSRIRKGTF